MAEMLMFAAAPTFALMALLTALFGGSAADVLCGGAQDASPLGGMVAMYVLMSAFHTAPWLKLIANWRAGGGCRKTEVENLGHRQRRASGHEAAEIF